jgi:hypothetical protein
MQVNTTPRIKVMTERGKRNSNACEMHANWNTRQLHATACALARSESQVAGRTRSDTICNDPFVTSMNSEVQ